MRSLFRVLGTLILVGIVAAAIGVGVLVQRGRALDAESRSFVDGAVPAIAAGWSQQQLLDRATPELRASVKPEEWRALNATVAELGPFVGYDGATGQSNMAYTTGSGSLVSASYVAQARFRDGIATLRMLLLKRDGRWMISLFHVDAARTGGPGQNGPNLGGPNLGGPNLGGPNLGGPSQGRPSLSL